MDAAAITQIAQDTLVVLRKLSIPLLLVALVVGVLISLVQTLTQIQEPIILLEASHLQVISRLR